MSRKWLDDGIEFKLLLNNGVGFDHLPGQTDTRYDPGHLAVDPISGLRFTNEGPNDRSCALFVSREYNALILFAGFEELKPTLVATGTGDAHVAIAGTNSVATLVTFQTASGNAGGLLLTTNTNSNDQTILVANTNSIWGAITSYYATNSVNFQTQVVTNATITGETIWAGLKLTNTSTTATDDDQTFFRYQDAVNSGKWQTVDSTAGVDNAQDSGVTVAASTSYLLQVKVGNDLIPRYYINGQFVAKGKALTSTAALLPFVGVQATTASARAVVCRYIRLVLPRTTV
jgi:hypothetical protein